MNDAFEIIPPAAKLFLLVISHIAGLVPLCLIVYLIYYLLTLPIRRAERARLFLDMIEVGLKDGDAPETTVLNVVKSRDPLLGGKIHALVPHIQRGLRLGAALQHVPRLLPLQISAMLKAGDRIGDISRVLPACRRLLNDGVSQVRGALNYVVMLAFVVTPISLAMPLLIQVLILPRFREIFSNLTEGASDLPQFTVLMIEHGTEFATIQISLILFVWFLMLTYIGGPRLHEWMRRIVPGVPDRIVFSLPWRRKRMQRDFSAMLAMLLDANVPEADAVALAAESTANGVIRRRADLVMAQLGKGVKLPEAIRSIDDSGELHWRLSNALQQSRGFLRALAGWHDGLDAKAFQLEQAATHVTTTLLVLINGLIVAGIVIGIFLALVQMLNVATLW